MSSSSFEASVSIFFFLIMAMNPRSVISTHIINFQLPNLLPIGFAWNPTTQNFIIGSLNHHSINSISVDGAVRALSSDHSLPHMVSIMGFTIDSHTNRLLIILHAFEPRPSFNALVAYDLSSGDRVFLTRLPNSMVSGRRPVATDVAVDHSGNAYVTNPTGNFIWKVEVTGKPSILSTSAISPFRQVYNGLTGIAYVSNGFLLVVQRNTGKLFKIDANGGAASLVSLKEDLTEAERIAVRDDGVVVVMSKQKVWFLKSSDGWNEAVVYDEIVLDADKQPISVAIREKKRTYLLYRKVTKGSLGSMERGDFSIEEIIGLVEEKKEEFVGRKNTTWSTMDVNASLSLSLSFDNMGHICLFAGEEERARFECAFSQEFHALSL